MAPKSVPGFVFILVTYHFHTRCMTSLGTRLSLLMRLRGSSRTPNAGFLRKIRMISTAGAISRIDTGR